MRGAIRGSILQPSMFVRPLRQPGSFRDVTDPPRSPRRTATIEPGQIKIQLDRFLFSSEDVSDHFIKSLLAVGPKLANPWLRLRPQAPQPALRVDLWPKLVEYLIHGSVWLRVVAVVRAQFAREFRRLLDRTCRHFPVAITQLIDGAGLIANHK